MQTIKQPVPKLHTYITAVSLFALTLMLLEPSVNSGFLKLDDDEYIQHNYVIHSGLSLENLKWAFTSFYASNWHPVTWISHMVDIQLFGLEPSLHHRVSFVIHGLNTILLLLLFLRITKQLFPSALIAALFGFHSLHTEPVIWLSERKEILSATFGFLSLIAYTKYSEKKRWLPYLSAIFFFCLSLLSKPTLVTLPFLLLLLDFRPLNRFSENNNLTNFSILKTLLIEKTPFFILTICSCFVTIKAQSHGGALQSLHIFPLPERTCNAIYSYIRYGLHTLFPFNLSVIYPHPEHTIPGYKLAVSLLLLIAITTCAVRKATTSPWFLTGWLWFLGTLVPTIGLVQVGGQAMADRYTYFPLIGLFAIFSFWVSDSGPIKYVRNLKKVLAVFVCLLIYINACFQAALWKDGVTLFRHAIRSTGSTPVAHHLLGLGYAERKEFHLAISEYKKSLSLYPDNKRVLNNMGIALLSTDKINEAIKIFKKALEVSPDYEYSLYHLGYAYFIKGEYKKAIAELSKAVSFNPLYKKAYLYLGRALSEEGRSIEAEQAFKKSISISPHFTEALIELGILYSEQGKTGRAVTFFEQVLNQDKENHPALFNLGTIYAREKKYEKAKFFLNRLLALKSDPDASFNLGAILLEEKDYTGAADQFLDVLKLAPEDVSAKQRYEYAVRKLKGE